VTSIKDVAKQAGVSIATVSLVLNNKGNISEETRQRVLQTVERLGYTRSIQARNLREQQSRTIGYAQRTQRGEFNPLLDRFLYELVNRIEPTGRHLLLFQSEPKVRITPYEELIKSRRVDGFVLSYTEAGDERFRYLHEAGVPFVAFGKSSTELDNVTHWVDVDGQYGIYIATEHLIQQGHRRIGFIGWPPGSASGDLRFQGFQDALTDYGIAIQPDLICRAHNQIEHGHQAAQKLLQLPQPPTAVVCVSDILAIGAMQYFNQANRRLAITGFDDTPTAAFTYPALTSVRQPIEEVTKLLVDMLLAQLDGQTVLVKQHNLKPELIIRASSLLDD